MILAKGKSKRRIRKQPVNENVENLEAPTAKKKKTDVEVASKNSKPKPKARAVKKKPDINNDMKAKVNNKAKAVNDNETENDVKLGDDKFTKVTAPRKTRGRKNESNSDDITNNDETTEKLSSSETVDTNNESEEAENNESELAQTVKKGRNVKKKEVPQKKPTKTRGKAASNEDIDTTIVVKEAQKKTNKDALVTIKRVRGKVTENTTEEKKVLNSSETLNSNNNIQKLLEDNDKKEDAENEEIKHTKTSGMSKKIDDVIIRDEINENNVMSTSVNEEEN